MASELHIIATTSPAAPSEAALAARIDEVGAELGRLEQAWSRFIATSDISRLNRAGAAGGGMLTVAGPTQILLAAMIEGYRRTAGRFDPTVLPAVVAAGYAASRVDPSAVCGVPAAAGPRPARASVLDLTLDAAAGTVVVPAGLALDPGGIGKSLAADLAVARLLALGAAGAMVGIGGDLAMAGSPPDPAGWLIEVERPDPGDGVLCPLAVSGGGVATSSIRSRRWTGPDGVERHHQIDPRTGRCSATDLDAVTVVAPSGWLAEVHATAALAAGRSQVVAYLDGHGLSGVAVGRGCTLATGDLALVELAPPGMAGATVGVAAR